MLKLIKNEPRISALIIAKNTNNTYENKLILSKS